MDLAQIRNASAQAERLLFEHSFSGEIVLKINPNPAIELKLLP
jgi:hypothetical protein